MIPTIIVVNDTNPLLDEYISLFKLLTRVVVRTSFQGEQLYSDGNGPFVEGILFFDATGRKRIVRRDNYKNIISEITSILIGSNSDTQAMIKTHLEEKFINANHANSYLESKKLFMETEDKLLLKEYIAGIYGTKSSI
jgi:hypothetical protein